MCLYYGFSGVTALCKWAKWYIFKPISYALLSEQEIPIQFVLIWCLSLLTSWEAGIAVKTNLAFRFRKLDLLLPLIPKWFTLRGNIWFKSWCLKQIGTQSRLLFLEFLMSFCVARPWSFVLKPNASVRSLLVPCPHLLDGPSDTICFWL